jgi:hypothetical protein
MDFGVYWTDKVRQCVAETRFEAATRAKGAWRKRQVFDDKYAAMAAVEEDMRIGCSDYGVVYRVEYNLDGKEINRSIYQETEV